MNKNTSINKSSLYSANVCLQVLPRLDIGGVERGVLEIAAGLVSSGRRALVASEGGDLVRELKKVGAEHFSLPLSSKSPVTIFRNASQLANLIRTESVSIIHARSRAPAWSSLFAARWAKIPFLTTFHGAYSTGPLGIKKMYNRVMTKGNPVIAISKFILMHLINEYKIKQNKVILIPRGVDLKAFDPNSVSAARMIQFSKEWRLPDVGPVIMLPGRIASWKGHGILIDAIKNLYRIGKLPKGFRCLMVSHESRRGSYRKKLERKLKKLKLENYVQIIDDCTDIITAYMLTDVVVSASTRPEAFGRVVAEAQAMGRPVVAPSHGAASEIIVPGTTGWLFSPGDSISLAGALDSAMSLTPDQRSELALKARQNILENFDLKHMINDTLEAYEKAVQNYSN